MWEHLEMWLVNRLQYVMGMNIVRSALAPTQKTFSAVERMGTRWHPTHPLWSNQNSWGKGNE